MKTRSKSKRSDCQRLNLSKETIKALVPKELQVLAGGAPCCLTNCPPHKITYYCTLY